MSAIKQAVDLIGGQTATAKTLAFGVTQTQVWNWVNRHQQAPAKYIKRISELTNGRVTVDELLADHETNAKGGAHE
ncbi:YdaS family helix-turn-helix protein [Pseudoalteromonas ruthenica]|uniref:YdaS family helix-turn-helix protein n=1 Tax=Pseudoalteromonas ruthenica TaxID=151081 RepID=UPI00241F8BBA|nr:YdaS family helix-turn-helix protein [Pseudoalteromonas ruthenica]|tara:strand:+ start:54514 stop:54741 length:228 start_codon:yes stop_codon:yes gene_type:complete